MLFPNFSFGVCLEWFHAKVPSGSSVLPSSSFQGDTEFCTPHCRFGWLSHMGGLEFGWLPFSTSWAIQPTLGHPLCSLQSWPDGSVFSFCCCSTSDVGGRSWGCHVADPRGPPRRWWWFTCYLGEHRTAGHRADWMLCSTSLCHGWMPCRQGGRSVASHPSPSSVTWWLFTGASKPFWHTVPPCSPTAGAGGSCMSCLTHKCCCTSCIWWGSRVTALVTM
jgi:hypothetical protein